MLKQTINLIRQSLAAIITILLHTAMFSFSLLLFIATSLSLIITAILQPKTQQNPEIIDVKAENVWFDAN